jgi:hypothetical protein
MIYIALVLAVAILVLRSRSPKRYAVHASTAIPLPEGINPADHWLLGGFLRDEHGALVDVDTKFIGTAVRDSMAMFGLPDGVTFIGDYMGAKKAQTGLKACDIVVVDGVHGGSQVGLRLRRVDKVHENVVDFLPDGLGKEHRSRPVTELIARVTHVVNSRGKSGLISAMPIPEEVPAELIPAA